MNKSKTNDFIKCLFSIISLFFLLEGILGKSHNVGSFYRGLFFVCYPHFIDTTSIVSDIMNERYNSDVRNDGDYLMYRIALCCSAVCTIGSLIILLSRGDFPQIIEHRDQNKLWGLSCIMIPFYLFSFYVMIIRPISSKFFKNSSIPFEKRPNE